MTRRMLLTVLSAAGFASCAAASRGTPPKLPSSLPVVSSPDFVAIIDSRFVNFPDSWTPTEQEVLLADPRVQECVLSERRRLRSSLARYVRHYQGWTRDGRRTLVVQFLDSRHFSQDELASTMVVVDSDDDTYFVVSFDIESGKCTF